jgi:hypothetical protein
MLKQRRLLAKIMSARQMSTSEKPNRKRKRGKKGFALNQKLSLAFGVFHTVAQGIVFPRH